jgi:hypothetical protein
MIGLSQTSPVNLENVEIKSSRLRASKAWQTESTTKGKTDTLQSVELRILSPDLPPVRYNPRIKRYYQRKSARTHPVVAIKTVAHKLARACYYILRDQVAFDVTRAFA